MLNETESYLEDGIPFGSVHIMIQRRERYQDTAVLRSGEAIGAGCDRTFVRWRTVAAVLGSYRLKKEKRIGIRMSRAKVHLREGMISSAIEALRSGEPRGNHRPEVAADRVPYILPAVAPTRWWRSSLQYFIRFRLAKVTVHW